MKNREVSVDPARVARGQRPGHRQPETPYEALMVAPNDVVETSVVESIALRDVLDAAIETALTPQELWVFNALVVERQSVRQLGQQLSIPKTTICRIRERALAKLRDALQDNPAVLAHLTGDT